VKLTTQALQPARVLGQRGVGQLVSEVDVSTGEAFNFQVTRQAFQQFETLVCTRRQQAWPTDRTERHGSQQLRVVLNASPLAGIRPTVIKHIFAVGMPLAVTGQRRHQPIALPMQQMLRLPTRLRAQAGAVFQCAQERVPHERLGLWHQCIPGLRGDFGQAVQALQRHRHPHWFGA